ncbi:general secretion pathway protein GspB [Noviherbaspirillum galbum]|uniref:General secretion pathway protein GspB n=1 Tax=Noviherbaspirillum galbum TaxID=2709383 RepID=A0A6B3SIV2_9BURK|nr:general secretion pathway protein GspB [Noviherbaspirillum galbum]NEX60747.1 general secretion pathway protein GspB [Noviherbaspirillum galbum]
MSYILDALKKAEAERRQGNAGGTFSGAPSGGPAGAPPSVWRTPWPWLAITVIAALGMGLAWLRLGPSPAPQAAPPAASPQSPVAPAAPAVADASANAPQAAVPSAAPVAPATHAPAPAAKAPSPAEHASAAQADERKPRPARRKETPKAQDRQEKQEKQEAKPAPAPALRELPEDLQRQIPAYSMNGYIYSGNKADRSVLINGRLMHEGDEIAPGLKLETMTANGMILNFRGTRFRTGY